MLWQEGECVEYNVSKLYSFRIYLILTHRSKNTLYNGGGGKKETRTVKTSTFVNSKKLGIT